MELMKNHFLKFENIKMSDGTIVKNITRFNLLPEIPDKFKSIDFTEKVKIDDNELIEFISFKLYETTDYWDILLFINNIKNLDELPVDYDILIDRAQREIDIWKNKYRTLSFELTDEAINNKYINILEDLKVKNEKFRFLTYIPVEYMSEIITYIDDNINLVKINKNIIINKD